MSLSTTKETAPNTCLEQKRTLNFTNPEDQYIYENTNKLPVFLVNLEKEDKIFRKDVTHAMKHRNFQSKSLNVS